MKNVRLTHTSFKPGAEGRSGQEIIVDDELAARWEAEGGCVVLGDAPAPKRVRTAAKDKPEVKR